MVHAAVGLPPCCAACREYDGDDGVCRLLAEPDAREPASAADHAVRRPAPPRPSLPRAGRGRRRATRWSPGSTRPGIRTTSRSRTARRRATRASGWARGRTSTSAAPRCDGSGATGARARRGRQRPTRSPTSRSRRPRCAVASALEQVRRIDAIGYAMLARLPPRPLRRARLGRPRWASAPASVTDRKYLAIYRYAVYFHEVLEALAPHEVAQSRSSRGASRPASPTEHAALEATRVALGEPRSRSSRWRQLYREGAARSLALLAERRGARHGGHGRARHDVPARAAVDVNSPCRLRHTVDARRWIDPRRAAPRGHLRRRPLAIVGAPRGGDARRSRRRRARARRGARGHPPPRRAATTDAARRSSATSSAGAAVARDGALRCRREEATDASLRTGRRARTSSMSRRRSGRRSRRWRATSNARPTGCSTRR